MIKKTIKIILVIILLSSLFMLMMNTSVFANNTGAEEGFLEGIFNSVTEFLKAGKSADSEGTAQEVAQEIQPLIDLLYWTGVAIVMASAMFLGIQYFKATGDPKERAEIKGKLTGFLISSVVLIAAYPIWKFLIEFISSLISGVS